MNRPLLAVACIWLASLIAWGFTLAQLSRPHAASIPDRSTLTRFPGP
jgi:hypothetical protein